MVTIKTLIDLLNHELHKQNSFESSKDLKATEDDWGQFEEIESKQPSKTYHTIKNLLSIYKSTTNLDTKEGILEQLEQLSRAYIDTARQNQLFYIFDFAEDLVALKSGPIALTQYYGLPTTLFEQWEATNIRASGIRRWALEQHKRQRTRYDSIVLRKKTLNFILQETTNTSQHDKLKLSKEYELLSIELPQIHEIKKIILPKILKHAALIAAALKTNKTTIAVSDICRLSRINRKTYRTILFDLSARGIKNWTLQELQRLSHQCNHNIPPHIAINLYAFVEEQRDQKQSAIETSTTMQPGIFAAARQLHIPVVTTHHSRKHIQRHDEEELQFRLELELAPAPQLMVR